MLLYQVSSNMVTFSSSLLDQIRRRISLIDVIGRYTTVQKRGSNVMACCPFHKEKSPSFYIYEEDGHYHCYGCKAHGDIFSFLMEKRGFSFPEVVEDLAGQAGLQIPQNGGDSEADRRTRSERELFHEIMEKAAQFYEKQLLSNSGSQAKAYIENRCIAPPTQKTFRLGYAPRGNVLYQYLSKLGYKTPVLQSLGLVQESRDRPGDFYDYFRDRLMFPIWDNRGRVIAFGGRILSTGNPKYINSPETPLFHKGDVIYGYHLAKQARAQDKTAPLICSEGYMDVVALHQGGFQGAVAPNGTSITENQLALLWKLDHEPIICLDGDEAGETAALRALKVALPFLESGKTLRFVSLPTGEDPDSLLRAGKKELLHSLYDTALPLVEKLWRTSIAGKSFDTPEQKAALRQDVFSLLNAIKDNNIRKSYEFDANDRLRAYMRQLSDSKYGQNKGGRFSSGSYGKRPFSQPATTHSVNANESQIRALFAGLLNYPSLLPEVESEFMELPLLNPSLIFLREEMINYLFEGLELDKEALNNHLYNKGLRDTVESICSLLTYTHAGFVRPSKVQTPEIQENVLENWLKVWHFCQGKSALEQDLKSAEKQLASVSTSENFSKVKRLQEELALLKS